MKAVMQMMPASAKSLAASPTRRMFSLRSCGRKTQVRTKAVAHVVAVQHIDVPAQVEEFALQIDGDGGFAGSGKPGQPDDAAGVAVAHGCAARGDLAVAPDKCCGSFAGCRRCGAG